MACKRVLEALCFDFNPTGGMMTSTMLDFVLDGKTLLSSS
jgi:hypothetical protein